MTLLEFIEARLAEDEHAARAAGYHRYALVDGEIATVGNGRLVVRLERDYDGPHIVRHDPARVLREVAAKRQLLERYARATAALPSLVSSYLRDEDSGYAEACEDVLRDMASVWLDHPDYDPTWSPA